MERKSDQVREKSQPAEPNQDAGQSEQDPATSDNPKVPPASETWVEGQPTSDADYR